MKPYLLTFCILVLYSSLYGQYYDIKSFDVDIYIQPEGYVDIVERFSVDYRIESQGIYRDIPSQGTVRVPGTDVDVYRQLYISGIQSPGVTKKVTKEGDPIRPTQISIRLGEKNKYLLGIQDYELRYRVDNVLLEDKDSIAILYWNVNGDEWDEGFDYVKLRVYVPAGTEVGPDNSFIYADGVGQGEYEKNFNFLYGNGVYEVETKSSYSLSRGQQLTVQVNVPRELIHNVEYEPPVWKEYGWVGVLGLILIGFWRLWLRYGKDDKVVATTSYYAPDGIDPAMAGYLIKDTGTPDHLIALIPYWANKGYLRVEEIPKSGFFKKNDMKLHRIAPLDANAMMYEKTIFNGLFASGNSVLISSLKESFYKKMNSAKSELSWDAGEYYVKESENIRQVTLYGSIVLAAASLFLLLNTIGVVAAVSTAIVFALIAGLSFYLKKKNEKGNRAYSDLLGFRRFIEVAELPQIEMLIREDPHYFENTMGYAVAFGLLKKWAGKFDALNIPPPEWYSGPHAMMSMSRFSDSFGNGMSYAKSTMTSTPSSSGGGGSGSGGGGGFSGGGFGGGGGGRW